MSYSLILVRVPQGASDEEVAKAARAATDAEDARAPGPPDLEAERRKRVLVDALLEGCPELEGGEPDYAALAKADAIPEHEARQRYHWWTVVGPEEGAGFEITLYDTFVAVEMASSGGTDEDWEDLWRYLEILVREGGFTVWDPQAPDVVDLAAGPFGDGTRKPRPTPENRRRRGTKGEGTAKRVAEPNGSGDAEEREEADDDSEREDARRGGAIAMLINRIIDEAIAAPLAAAGYKRTGRTWRRYLDDGVIQVVNIQWSPRDGSVEGSFTMNAGVYFPALAESLALFPPTKTPKEHDCHVRERPMIPGRDGWRVRVPGLAKPDPDLGNGRIAAFFAWLDRRADRKAPKQHEQATRELRESLERHTLPWLEEVRTLRDARDYFKRRGPAFWAAHASLLLGERDEAKRILEQDLARAKPERAAMLRAWGRATGLLA